MYIGMHKLGVIPSKDLVAVVANLPLPTARVCVQMGLYMAIVLGNPKVANMGCHSPE